MKIIKLIAIAAISAISLTLVTGAANAVTFTPCDELSPDATNKLLSNDGCVGLDNLLPNNNSNPELDDFDGMFGVAEWTKEIGKTSVSGNIDVDVGGFTFKSTDGNLTGTWSVSQSLLDMYGSLAIVMKDGNQLPIPTIAYLISSTNGSWSTPWVNSQGAANPSLSNVRLIVGDPSVIPLPAAGWLLLAGLGGLAVYGRKKRWA